MADSQNSQSFFEWLDKKYPVNHNGQRQEMQGKYPTQLMLEAWEEALHLAARRAVPAQASAPAAVGEPLLPAMPTALYQHPKLGAMWDRRFAMHQYAVKYGDALRGLFEVAAAQSPSQGEMDAGPGAVSGEVVTLALRDVAELTYDDPLEEGGMYVTPDDLRLILERHFTAPAQQECTAASEQPVDASNPTLSELIEGFPELNMSNYGDDEVSELNVWGIEVCAAYGRERAAPSPQAPVTLDVAFNRAKYSRSVSREDFEAGWYAAKQDGARPAAEKEGGQEYDATVTLLRRTVDLQHTQIAALEARLTAAADAGSRRLDAEAVRAISRAVRYLYENDCSGPAADLKALLDSPAPTAPAKQADALDAARYRWLLENYARGDGFNDLDVALNDGDPEKINQAIDARIAAMSPQPADDGIQG